jgi:2-polyprenyl-6-methoxyphenol hydroxylase-like FAD-dependent oxidoreductase
MTSDVIIAGAGPTGLWLAAELRLAGVAATVLERSPERGTFTRGMGVHARTLEVLAMRCMADIPLSRGRVMPRWHFGMLPSMVDFSALDSRYPFVLAYPQPLLEELLERHAIDLGATVLRGYAVSAVTQDGSSVRVLAEGPGGPKVFEGGYAVGCDGAGSTVRKAAGIAFPGTDATLFGYLGDVTLDNPPERGSAVIASQGGALIIAPLPAGGRYRVAGFDPHDQGPGDTLTPERLRDSVVRAAGHDFGLRDPSWLSRFGNATRQAAAYRAGRVLLAGDAAHMHLPTGGVGLNVGIQDSMNLGWKLAAVAQGRAPDDLLSTYHDERHPVGAALLTSTRAQTALIAAFTAEGLALREKLAGLIDSVPEFSRQLAWELSGLDVAYPPATTPAHPLTGTRVPDFRVEDSTVFRHLTRGRALLLNFTGRPGALGAAAEFADALGIPARVAGPWPGHDKLAAALIRPDGYVWWATDQPSGDDVISALTAAGIRF